MNYYVNQTKNTEKDLISFGITKLHVIFARDMKKFLFILIMALGSLAVQAQEVARPDSGFHVSFGASVFTSFGKHRVGGTGFAQSIDARYSVPLSSRAWLSVGGYFRNINWRHNSYRDAGVNAVLGYRFDEHWEAYIYGQKSFLKPEMPLPLFYMNDVGDRIGAAVRYSPNRMFSVTVSVEGRSEPSWLPAMTFGNHYSDFPYRGIDW